jgi:hypothetical protein
MHGVRLVRTPAMKSTPTARRGLVDNWDEIAEKSMS